VGALRSRGSLNQARQSAAMPNSGSSLEEL